MGAATHRSVIGLMLLSALAACAGAPGASPLPSASIIPCAYLDPPCPPVLPAVLLSEPKDYSAAGVGLDPAPDVPPPVTSSQAVDIAWANVGPGIDATSLQPIFATYRSTNAAPPETALIWAVRFVGACFPNLGPPGGATGMDCLPDLDLYAVINALTGDLMFMFSG